MLNGKAILVTGGTGSFGKEFVRTVLTRFPQVRRLVVYSRDEVKQFEMSQIFSPREHRAVRYFIGDVRDRERLERALEGIEIVVHAAALKQVPTAEYNPFECIKTNILGAQNVIEAALSTDVHKIVALSTDKAAAPINLYGASKLCADKLFIAANNMKGSRDLSFSVVRYGNVMGSRGSVIPYFLEQKKNGVLPITDPEMTRFNITLTEGVNLVLFAIANAIGGEILVPKIPSYSVTDVAQAIGPDCKQSVIGIRPGEKVHEEMITVSDSPNTVEAEDHYVVVPNLLPGDHQGQMDTFATHYKARRVAAGFRYSSDQNEVWLGVDEIRELIRKHVDAEFRI